MTREILHHYHGKEGGPVLDYGEALRAIDPETEWDGDDCTVTCPDGCRIEVDCPDCICGHKNPIVEAGLI